MGFRQCAEEGCAALEYKTAGWCLRHKDQNEPVPMVDYWWTEKDESDPSQANVEHSPHCVCINCKPTEPELPPVPEPPSRGGAFFFVLLIALPILAGIISSTQLQYEYYDGNWNNEEMRDPTTPESPNEVWSWCKPELYNAWWTYDFLPTNDTANDTGDLRVFWDADLSCDKSASITVIVTITPSGQFIGNAEKRLLHYTTYGNQWDNKSMLFGDDIDGNGFGSIHPGEYLVDIDILFNYFLSPTSQVGLDASNEVHMTIELSILSTQGSLMESESTGLWSDWN
jgi:hypothetical protein|tara:strand:- start:86 stop:937 length:852 start_codon:yes stop_codon:yes gene_type:complete